MKIRLVASFTKIRFVVSWLFQKTWIVSQVKYIHRFQRKNFTFWRFYFTYSRISTNNLFRSKAFDRMSINFAKFRTRNLLCCRREDDFVIVIADWKILRWKRHRRKLIEISCWRWNRHELTTILFFFTRWSSQRVWNLHRSSR